MRTTPKTSGKLTLAALVVLFGGAAGRSYCTTQRAPSQPAESNKPADWKSEFGKARAGKKDLYGFIETVVNRSAPPGYALEDRYGDSRNVWVEDLNGDGQSDLAFSLTTKPPTNNILRIVTPLRFDGSSQVLAELSGHDLEVNAPEGVLTGIEGSIDFNHDGERELLIEADANKPTSEIFKINFIEKTVRRLQARTGAGESQPVQIVSAGGFGYMVDQFLRDVDRDGIDDFVCQARRFTDGSNETIESATLSVFKWNGTFFDYSQSLSDQLAVLLDPAKDIPAGPWPEQANLPR